jgi:sugar phosphate isomerase/epimerase
VVDHSDIGVSTGAFAQLSLAEALERIARLAPSAEICSWHNHSLLAAGNARAVAGAGLPFTVHGPFTHGDIGKREVWRAALREHRQHMEIASRLGAALYVVHPDMQPRPGPWSRRVAASLERLFAELRQYQDELGLPVAVENMPLANRSHFTTPGDIELKGLGLALDVGHAAMTGTLTGWLADPSTELRHVHLHDNLGHRAGDRHQPLGTGVIDVAPALAKARAAGATLVLEHLTETDVIASLEHLRARGLLDGAGPS